MRNQERQRESRRRWYYKNRDNSLPVKRKRKDTPVIPYLSKEERAIITAEQVIKPAIEATKKRAAERFEKNKIPCKQCGSWFISKNKNPQFCSMKCWRKNQQDRTGRSEFCENGCGERIVGKAKHFCSQACHRDFEYKDFIEKWKRGEVLGGSEDGYKTHRKVRRYILEKSNYCCEQCGWSGINIASGKSTVCVDHKDGNAGNNAEENLRALCPNCHSLTPTFGGLNRGNGRPTRRGRDKKYSVGKIFVDSLCTMPN
jgi:hypothetical protein